MRQIDKAILVKLTDKNGMSGAELYKKLNILRVTRGITWKDFVLGALASHLADTDRDLSNELIEFIDNDGSDEVVA